MACCNCFYPSEDVEEVATVVEVAPALDTMPPDKGVPPPPPQPPIVSNISTEALNTLARSYNSLDDLCRWHA